MPRSRGVHIWPATWGVRLWFQSGGKVEQDAAMSTTTPPTPAGDFASSRQVGVATAATCVTHTVAIGAKAPLPWGALTSCCRFASSPRLSAAPRGRRLPSGEATITVNLARPDGRVRGSVADAPRRRAYDRLIGQAIQRTLVNLIDNAPKHAPPGSCICRWRTKVRASQRPGRHCTKRFPFWSASSGAFLRNAWARHRDPTAHPATTRSKSRSMSKSRNPHYALPP